MNESRTIFISHGAPGMRNLSWAGDPPPFLLLKANTLSPIVEESPGNFFARPAWYPVDGPTLARNKVVPATGLRGFFRVQYGVPMFAGEQVNGVNHLEWALPELDSVTEGELSYPPIPYGS